MLVTSTQMHRQGETASKSDFDIKDAMKHVMKSPMPMPMGTRVYGHVTGSYPSCSNHGALCCHWSPVSNKVVSVRLHTVAQHKSCRRSKTDLPAPPLLALATFTAVQAG